MAQQDQSVPGRACTAVCVRVDLLRGSVAGGDLEGSKEGEAEDESGDDSAKGEIVCTMCRNRACGEAGADDEDEASVGSCPQGRTLWTGLSIFFFTRLVSAPGRRPGFGWETHAGPIHAVHLHKPHCPLALTRSPVTLSCLAACIPSCRFW